MRLLTLVLIIILSSCASTKVRKKRIMVDDLRQTNQLYSVKNNSYFYFMIDSVGNKYLVKTHLLNSEKVIWTERLTRK